MKNGQKVSVCALQTDNNNIGGVAYTNCYPTNQPANQPTDLIANRKRTKLVAGCDIFYMCLPADR